MGIAEVSIKYTKKTCVVPTVVRYADVQGTIPANKVNNSQMDKDFCQ